MLCRSVPHAGCNNALYQNTLPCRPRTSELQLHLSAFCAGRFSPLLGICSSALPPDGKIFYCLVLVQSCLLFSCLVSSVLSYLVSSVLSCQLLFCLVWRFDSLSNVIAWCNDDSVPWCRQAACHYRSGCAEILGCQLSIFFF